MRTMRMERFVVSTRKRLDLVVLGFAARRARLHDGSIWLVSRNSLRTV